MPDPMFDFVKVLNPITDPSAPNYRTLHYVHQGRVYDIKPGTSVIVGFDVAAAMFGHPMERDNGANRGRTDNLRRIRLQWGYQEGALNAAELWETQMPPFRVELQDGTYVPMVLDDPDGVLPLPGEEPLAVPVDPTVAALTDMIARMQQQISQMQGMLATDIATATPVSEQPSTQDAALAIPSAAADTAIIGNDDPAGPTPSTGTTLGGNSPDPAA